MTYEAYSMIERRQVVRTRGVWFGLLVVACTSAAITIGLGGSALTGKIAHLLQQLLATL